MAHQWAAQKSRGELQHQQAVFGEICRHFSKHHNLSSCQKPTRPNDSLLCQWRIDFSEFNEVEVQIREHSIEIIFAKSQLRDMRRPWARIKEAVKSCPRRFSVC
ncbi:hypothetical protein FA15DRAFT_676116 [Coprinopsis marcescibilis]|uniref:Uncharacterized protein n=1 Tax=Coprinopsis marcescibilis TaxID=230819 RepID=A0A5C3KC87_COPMA|nr:hypothetical protein FA15DRAFT_676116 [Coprinopsis marcescibilis]